MQAALNLDEYRRWIVELKKRYRSTQIKAAISVNAALLEFYWELGRDISAKYPGKRRNVHFFENLSVDLQTDIEDPKGLSERNIRYALKFFELYAYLPQLAANSGEASSYLPQVVADKDKDGTSVAKNVVQNDSPLIECLIRIPCVGQLGFYMTAVDRQIKNPWDADTVGLVLCGEKDKTIVEYALNMSRVPMGVAQYTLSYTKEPPKELEEMAPALARLGQVVDETIKINNDIKYRRGDELNAEE